MELDDVGCLILEMELNSAMPVENRGHSGLGKCWRCLPGGSEVWGDQEMEENSNAEVS